MSKKKKYNKPLIEVTQFYSNQFISSCTSSYAFNCNVQVPGGRNDGLLIEDMNNNGHLDAGDRIVNHKGGEIYEFYAPCNETHYLQNLNSLKEGFMITKTDFDSFTPDMNGDVINSEAWSLDNFYKTSVYFFASESSVNGHIWHASSKFPTPSHS